MRKFLFSMMLTMLSLGAFAQGMTDSQVADFIAREAAVGTSQAQIVTKLMQKGVQIDQIRRVRNRFDNQNTESGMEGATAGETGGADRMRQNYTGATTQDLNTAKVGTTGEVYANASDEKAQVEHDVQATSSVTAGTGKKIFGHDIFNRGALSFEPNMNIATPQNYVLGPGDQVIIDIYGASQKTLQLTVSPEGDITVPGYGPIMVAGMSVAAAQSKIRSTVGSRYSSSTLRTTLGNTRTIMVNVMGEVRTPGTYHLSAFASVFHALYMAGGINDNGTLRNVKVYRNGQLVTIVDIYEYILNGRLAGNIRLQEGDVIQVGLYDCLVGVTGNVKRPMFYEMRKNESVATLIKYAGGFTGDAYKKSIRLTRQTGEKYAVYTVDEFELSSFHVDDGDAIEVDGILNRYENMVEVKGAVFRPGQYQLGNEINSVRSLIAHAAGVTEDAMTNRGVLHRLKADRSLEVIAVDIKGIMAGTVPDIPLRNEDVLFIPTEADLRQQRTLTITGEVMSPGTYQYADNTTLEDLIVQAGGLTDQASTARVDISRRIRDPKATTSPKEISKSFTFGLKDGFVVDGTPGFLLEPYDVVHVRRSPGFKTPRNFTITGEVVYEGAQTMTTKNMRLSDAIKLAGGLTDQAYPKNARLERVMNEDEIARRNFLIEQVRKQAGVRGSDSVAVNQLALANTYPVGIYLDKALANPGCEEDIVLREGDHIVVPEYISTVKVSGNVMYPNTVSYKPGKSYTWYVNQAGGFGNHAKKRKTWIIYPNGTMSQVGHGAKIEPGCEIVVPMKPKPEAGLVQQWVAIGQSVASMAALMVIMIKQF
ncbi:SLBB domain-containing protein [Prevotella sp. tf2-5]|uniref:SLBB domain-containing protein n=1 Tax=Prevotella sp. tf2-5 TaxID=1761889 RepID=UPI0008F3D66D|nr:SLBB domain-containing protein [Prevotella sp. tf2-5]SFP01563.1 protein involved in polysaccharide export, contains SLBB domain of the beta-grasp fold [Prevotella sp. tf2-5]